MSIEADLMNDDWKNFTLAKELEETRKALEKRERQVEELKKKRYWFARSYRKHINKL